MASAWPFLMASGVHVDIQDGFWGACWLVVPFLILEAGCLWLLGDISETELWCINTRLYGISICKSHFGPGYSSFSVSDLPRNMAGWAILTAAPLALDMPGFLGYTGETWLHPELGLHLCLF